MRVILIVFLFSSITSYSMWDTLYIDSSTYIYRNGWQQFIIKSQDFEISCEVPRSMKKEELGKFLNQRKNLTSKRGIVKMLNRKQEQMVFDTSGVKWNKYPSGKSQFSCNLRDTILPVSIRYKFQCFSDTILAKMEVEFDYEPDYKDKCSSNHLNILKGYWDSKALGLRHVYMERNLVLQYDINRQRIIFVGIISRTEEMYFD